MKQLHYDLYDHMANNTSNASNPLKKSIAPNLVPKTEFFALNIDPFFLFRALLKNDA